MKTSKYQQSFPKRSVAAEAYTKCKDKRSNQKHQINTELPLPSIKQQNIQNNRKACVANEFF